MGMYPVRITSEFITSQNAANRARSMRFAKAMPEGSAADSAGEAAVMGALLDEGLLQDH